MSVFLGFVSVAALVIVGLGWLLAQKILPEPENEAAPCWRCEGHGCIEIYSTSDEYAAPCPVCKGPVAYHAKIERKEGCIPAELRWPQGAASIGEGK